LDGSYLIERRLDCSSTDSKMVFLVREIESMVLFVLKFYKLDEGDSFVEEARANTHLQTSSMV